MSNITLFKDPLPARFANLSGVDEDTKSLTGGGSTMRRLSIKGGVFREMVGGKEHRVSEERAINIAVVRSAPHNSRQFYAGSYVEGAKTAPGCWSSDGVKPDEGVGDKQSATCSACPQNIKGSGQGTSRACRFQRRLAVLLDGEIERGEVYQLIVPATSLFGDGERGKMPLQKYAAHLDSHKMPITEIVTEVRFDTAATQEKLIFKAVRPLTDAEAAVVKEMRDSAEAIAAVSHTAARMDGVGAEPEEPLFAEEAPKEEEPKAPVKAAPKAVKAAPKEEVVGEEPEEPKKAVGKKPAAPAASEPKLADLVGEWDD